MNTGINLRSSKRHPSTESQTQAPLVAKSSNIFFPTSNSRNGVSPCRDKVTEISAVTTKVVVNFPPHSPQSGAVKTVKSTVKTTETEFGGDESQNDAEGQELEKKVSSSKHCDTAGLLPARSAKEILTKRNSSIMCSSDRFQQKSTFENRKKVIRLLMVVVLTFTILVLPYHIRVMMEQWAPRGSGSFGHTLFPQFTFILLYLNSAINPILYAFLSSHFRRCMLDVFRCQRRRETVTSVRFVLNERRMMERVSA